VATKKLKLPIIKGRLPQPKSLSMDEYLKFVKFNLKNMSASDREAERRRAKKARVNVPFVL